MNSATTRLSLLQVIAWIGWHDTAHPIGSPPPRELPLAPHLGEVAEEGRSWWAQNLDSDQKVRDALSDIERRVGSGELSVAGFLVEKGMPPNVLVSGQRHDPIPREITRLPCRIPWEWLGTSNGGWILFEKGLQDGLPIGPRYCSATFNASDVKKIWPKPIEIATPPTRRPSASQVGRFMNEEASRANGMPLPRPDTIARCIATINATSRQASAGWKRLDDKLKRPAHATAF